MEWSFQACHEPCQKLSKQQNCHDRKRVLKQCSKQESSNELKWAQHSSTLLIILIAQHCSTIQPSVTLQVFPGGNAQDHSEHSGQPQQWSNGTQPGFLPGSAKSFLDDGLDMFGFSLDSVWMIAISFRVWMFGLPAPADLSMFKTRWLCEGNQMQSSSLQASILHSCRIPWQNPSARSYNFGATSRNCSPEV